jgi:hypothetical protein
MALFGRKNDCVREDKIQPFKLNVGNELMINSKFSYLNEPKNPNEFNYKAFLESKNVFHTVFTESKNISAISRTIIFNLSQIGT